MRELCERRIPVYKIRDEDAWYKATQPTDDPNDPTIPTSTPGLRLVGIVLAGGYREGEDVEYLYTKNGRLYAEEVLTGDNTGVAIPVQLTLFQIRQYLDQVDARTF